MNASPLRTKHKDEQAKIFQKTKREPHSEYYPIFGSQHALFFKIPLNNVSTQVWTFKEK